MEKERISRVLSLALNTERLKERQLNASSLISEINIDYGRTMSAIIFARLADPRDFDAQRYLPYAQVSTALPCHL